MGRAWIRLRQRLRSVRLLIEHARRDGFAIAFAFFCRAFLPNRLMMPRDPGERAAERFMRALGYRVIARNWRNPRDRRDEADIVALSPDRRTLVIAEVKRASGPWDPLERVDSRKKEVLWRLLLAFEQAALARRRALGGAQGFPAAIGEIDRIRVDLVGVEGVGRTCAVRTHVAGLFERAILRGPRTRAPPRS